MINDGFHHYTYDAEGNITQVDGGTTATYVYNALNQRVQANQGGTSREYIFSSSGKRVSVWDGNSHAQIQGQYYWGSKPIAFYTGGALRFQHQNWIGTERMQTSYNGSTEGSYQSLPWGDRYTPSGTNDDAYHYAQLDHDTESTTDHAQFRQYSPTQGRWMSPDPYDGSYDAANPQSLNRYSYALNNPLSHIDPSGLEPCDTTGDSSDAVRAHETQSGCAPASGGGAPPCLQSDGCYSVSTTLPPAPQPDPPSPISLCLFNLCSILQPTTNVPPQYNPPGRTPPPTPPAPNNGQQPKVQPTVICGGTYGQPCTPAPLPTCESLDTQSYYTGAAGTALGGYSLLSSLPGVTLPVTIPTGIASLGLGIVSFFDSFLSRHHLCQ
jgi:RHS repeat-associated protein